MVRARRCGAAAIVVVTGVLLALVVVAAISLSVGDYALAPVDLWRTLWGGGERIESYVVFQLRAPRLAMAIVAGAALGVSGALLQSLLSNPLASPDLLGISGGAGVAAVFGILVLGIVGPFLAVVAFVGGLVVAAFLLLAGSRRGDGEYRLVVAGIGVSFLCVSITGYLMTRAQVELAQAALIWLTGSLASTPWWNVAGGADRLGGRSARDRRVRALAAADPAGRGHRRLARSAARCRPHHTVVVAVLLTSTTCAFVGPISFIALCAPAIARPLLGHGAVGIGTSAAVGALLLAGADLIAQYAIPGISLPVGVVTGALGSVFLLWLLTTSKGRQL